MKVAPVTLSSGYVADQQRRPHGAYKASRPFSTLFSASLPICTLVTLPSLLFFFPCPPSGRRRVSGSHWRISYCTSRQSLLLYADIQGYYSAGGVYVHTATKLVFVRFFRHSHHLHSHTVLGWTVSMLHRCCGWCGPCYRSANLFVSYRYCGRAFRGMVHVWPGWILLVI
jgi:hypothetical protein